MIFTPALSSPMSQGCAEQVSLKRCIPGLHRHLVSDLDRLIEGMKLAQQSYKQAVLNGQDEGPFLVAENISILTFENWCATLDTCWRVGFIYKDCLKGSVMLYGDPSKLHASVVAWFNDEVVLQVGRVWKKYVQSLGDAGQELAHGIKQPDASYTSTSARPPRTPRLTLEVAYRNEDLNKLVREVSDWHAAGVVLSIGIKVQLKEIGKGTDKELHVALFWVQQMVSDPKPHIHDFSPVVCTHENHDKFIIAFPFSYMSADIPYPEDFLIKIDLYSLQQHIMNQISLEAEENQKMLYVDNGGKFICSQMTA